MRTMQTARYARWSAIAAVLLVIVVAGLYTRRIRHSRETRPTAAPVPSSVQEQSAGFSLSKVTGDQTQFTVRASNATEFKEGGLSLLENVWITAFGNAAQRFDNLRTGSCNYVSATGLFTCAGPVQMDLQNSQDARAHSNGSASSASAARVVHINTSQLSFDGQTGVATTDKPVDFRLPQGEGHAIGARFESKEGGLQLFHDVHLTLRPSPPPAGSSVNVLGSTQVEISCASLVYDRDHQIIHLSGPVQVVQGSRSLQAGKLDVELDEELRVRRMVATDHPEVHSVQTPETASVSADEISATMAADGSVQQVNAVGNVRGERKRPPVDDHLTARHLLLEYTPATNQLHRITATNDVTVQSDLPAGASRHLATQSMVMNFVPVVSGKDMRLAHASTPQATLDSLGTVQSAGKTSAQRTRLTSQRLEAEFGEQSDLQNLHGLGGVEVRRQMGDMPASTSTSREMLAQFTPSGDWSSIEQTGEVVLRNADKTAQTPRALFDNAAGSATLAGPVTLTDQSSRTTANSGKFVQSANEFQAEGNIVTTEIEDPAAPDPRGPAHISSDRLAANTLTGHAIYTGHGRLWQGDSVVEGDILELDRNTQTLTANGRVHAIFPKQQQTLPGAAVKTAGVRPEFIRTESGRLIYQGAEHRARLELGAIARSDQGTIRSPSMDLFFVPGPAVTEGGSGAPKSSAPLAGIGNQTFERATALGGVEVEQLDRRGKAARADYTAADGKFVLSGDRPSVYDSLGNATNGRQLTFIFGDDSIIVDSEEGSRTLTLHRVEK